LSVSPSRRAMAHMGLWVSLCVMVLCSLAGAAFALPTVSLTVGSVSTAQTASVTIPVDLAVSGGIPVTSGDFTVTVERLSGVGNASFSGATAGAALPNTGLAFLANPGAGTVGFFYSYGQEGPPSISSGRLMTLTVDTSGAMPGDTYRVSLTAAIHAETGDYPTAPETPSGTITILDTTPPTVTATPTGGSYGAPQTVTLESSEAGTIYYTTDGSDPTTSATRVSRPVASAPYQTTVSIGAGTTTLKYYAVDASNNASQVASQTYVITTSAPTITAAPAGGTYNTAQMVTLTSSAAGTIYYTTDGSDPSDPNNAARKSASVTSAPYQTAVNIASTTTLRYVAVDALGHQSAVGSQTYTIDTVKPTVNVTPMGGTYGAALSVTIASSEAGAIQYTTNGDDPTLPTSNRTVVQVPTAPFQTSVSIGAGTTTLKYAAVDLAGNVSDVGVQTYVVDTTSPSVSVSPGAGAYNSAQTVVITSSKAGTIYYTTDGSDPGDPGNPARVSATVSSEPYQATVAVASSLTLKYVAVDALGHASAVGSATYTIDTVAPSVSASPAGGLYNAPQSVVLTAYTDATRQTVDTSAAIYYTLGGTDPTTASTRYTGPINIAGTVTLKFIAVDAAGNQSSVVSEAYQIDMTAPVVSATPAGGLFKAPVDVTLVAYTDSSRKSVDSGATIHYTTDGSTPTAASPTYGGPVHISDTTTLAFMAVDAAGNQSAPISETYTIDTVPPGVTGTSPANGATGVLPTAAITVSFSEDVQQGPAFGAVSISGPSGAVAFTPSISGSTLTLAPSAHLAPAASYTVTVPAGAVQDMAGNALPSQHQFSFTVVPVSVTVSAASNRVRVTKSTTLTATVVGLSDTSVLWYVNGVANGNASVGVVTTSGAGATYTAPSTPPAGGQVTVRAVSSQDPDPAHPSYYGEVTLTIRPAVAISLTPATATARATGNPVTFVASAANQEPGDPPLVWKVNGVQGGTAATGTVSQSGVYTPPATVPSGGTVTVSAESQENAAWVGVATVTVKPAPRVASVSPAEATGQGAIQIDGTNFGAGGTLTIGGKSDGIAVSSWSDSAIVAVQPGNLSGPIQVVVDGAASNTDVSFHIVSGLAGITITPANPTISIYDTVRFSAAVTDENGNPVTGETIVWTVTPDPTQPGAAVISQDGLLNPAAPGKVVVRAGILGREAEGRYGTTTVTILQAPVVSSVTPSVAPVGAEVRVTGQFFGLAQGSSVITIAGAAASVKSWSDQAIVATVPQGAGSGPVVVTVGTLSSTQAVQFTAITAIAITPSSAEVMEGASQLFTAVGKTADGSDVPGIAASWSAQPVPQVGGEGSVDPSGTFSATKAGLMTVTASYVGLTATAQVTITPKPIEGPPRFVFAPPALYPTGDDTQPRGLLLMDVTGDGRLDALTTSRSKGELIVLPGMPGGAFGTPVPSDIGGEPVALTEYDASASDREVAVADFASSTVDLLKPSGGGGVSLLKSLPEGVAKVLGGTYDITTGDYNGDGLQDLAVVDLLFGDRARLFLRRPDGTFDVQTVPASKLPVSVATADFNGDGVADLAIGSLYAGRLTVLMSDRTPGAATPFRTLQYTIGRSAYSVAAGDADGDGKPDIEVVDSAGDQVAVLLNNGDGTFAQPAYYPTGRLPRAVALGDLDGDGRPDLVVANENSNTVTILPGKTEDANGHFRHTFDAGTEVSVGGPPTAVVVRDLNGDGVPDIAVLLSATSQVAVLLNAFSPPAPASIRSIAPITGEVIEGDAVNVVFAASNVNLVNPATRDRNVPGEGHVVLTLVSDPPAPPVTVVAFTSQMVTFRSVPFGSHVLSIELLANDGTPLNPPARDEVRFQTVPVDPSHHGR